MHVHIEPTTIYVYTKKIKEFNWFILKNAAELTSNYLRGCMRKAVRQMGGYTEKNTLAKISRSKRMEVS
jgi:hypothetical protein